MDVCVPPRLPTGVCALNNCIYAMGGYDGTDQLNSTERYEVETDTWTFVAPMRYRRSALGVTVYQGKIYVLGKFREGVCFWGWGFPNSHWERRNRNGVRVSPPPPRLAQGATTATPSWIRWSVTTRRRTPGRR